LDDQRYCNNDAPGPLPDSYPIRNRFGVEGAIPADSQNSHIRLTPSSRRNGIIIPNDARQLRVGWDDVVNHAAKFLRPFGELAIVIA
jgi:hypothetical protein